MISLFTYFEHNHIELFFNQHLRAKIIKAIEKTVKDLMRSTCVYANAIKMTKAAIFL